MLNSRLAVINQVLALYKLSPCTSLDDLNDVGQILNAIMENHLPTYFGGEIDYACVRKVAQLTNLNNVKPLTYNYAYILPANFTRLRWFNCTATYAVEDFLIMGSEIWVNSKTPIMYYSSLVPSSDLANLPEHAVTGFAYYFAAINAPAILRDAELSKVLAELNNVMQTSIRLREYNDLPYRRRTYDAGAY